MNKDLFKYLQNSIKIFVTFGLVILTAHVGLLLQGINEPYSEWLFGFSISGFTMLLMASYVLKLCRLFRTILIYDFLVAQCIILQRSFELFSSYLEIMRHVVFCTGGILIILLIYKTFGNENRK